MHIGGLLPANLCLVTLLSCSSSPGLVSSKRISRMHLCVKLANNNHIGILDVLLTEAMIVVTENPSPLSLLSQIQHKVAESGPGRIWAHSTGIPSVLGVIYTTPCECAVVDFAKITTDVTLEQRTQTGHPREFP